MKITKEQLLKKNPCQEGLDFLNSCSSLENAWNTCINSEWMLWALAKLGLASKDDFAKLARIFADNVKHKQNDNATDAADDAAYAASTYATCVADSARAAVNTAYSAVDAVDVVNRLAERLFQCNTIRIHINPFK